MKEYKKSYKGLVIWILLYLLVLFFLAFIPIEDEKLLLMVIDNFTTIGVAGLMWMIYVNEKIYWFTGISYEEADRTPSQQRREYAIAHFKRFGIFAVLYLVYSVISFFLGVHYAVDIAVMTIGFCAVAVSTTGIKLG